MKVYYEKPTAEKLISAAIELAYSYKVLTGKNPNKIEMTKEEFNIIKSYVSFAWQFQRGEDYPLKNKIWGMEVVIK